MLNLLICTPIFARTTFHKKLNKPDWQKCWETHTMTHIQRWTPITCPTDCLHSSEWSHFNIQNKGQMLHSSAQVFIFLNCISSLSYDECHCGTVFLCFTSICSLLSVDVKWRRTEAEIVTGRRDRAKCCATVWSMLEVFLCYHSNYRRLTCPVHCQSDCLLQLSASAAAKAGGFWRQIRLNLKMQPRENGVRSKLFWWSKLSAK